mmetsp:Transcript_3683/g.9630  ORF Transcript_3683/g.9630 Transcript_3683/m.9630 type:complete len:132 (+) Transcript_3683:907-1302(+)
MTTVWIVRLSFHQRGTKEEKQEKKQKTIADPFRRQHNSNKQQKNRKEKRERELRARLDLLRRKSYKNYGTGKYCNRDWFALLRFFPSRTERDICIDYFSFTCTTIRMPESDACHIGCFAYVQKKCISNAIQ